ncbi:MAG: hypothetical protein NVSMB31_09840 [Vulcanimicrobiaceae bacterium]
MNRQQTVLASLALGACCVALAARALYQHRAQHGAEREQTIAHQDSLTFGRGDHATHIAESGIVRNHDPLTSHEAAASLDPQKLGDLQRAIVHILTVMGPNGATTSEIALHVKHPRDSVSPRMKTLVKANLAVDSGLKRAGPSGRAQTIWMTPSGARLAGIGMLPVPS